MNTIASNTTHLQSQLAQEGVAYAGEIAAAAERHGLDPRLLAAVAAQETGGPGSNSGRNILGDGGHGHGVFQIDDRWHAFARSAAAMNPAKNAEYAATMISGLLKQYGGNIHKALSAYNAGSPNATGTTTDWGGGKALGYADSVLRHFARLGGPQPHTMTAGPQSQPLAADAKQHAIADLPQEIFQTNQLQALSQSKAFQPRSFSHSTSASSFAGMISTDD
ncbi:MAG: transglycosylase SLT domain-containing protein [Candidatus Eremiobacteraeota bacterium]|nr:transglycosylase SLT domain-containing protein [Candidatus Eremiobacteraeota bacterium]